MKKCIVALMFLTSTLEAQVMPRHLPVSIPTYYSPICSMRQTVEYEIDWGKWYLDYRLIALAPDGSPNHVNNNNKQINFLSSRLKIGRMVIQETTEACVAFQRYNEIRLLVDMYLVFFPSTEPAYPPAYSWARDVLIDLQGDMVQKYRLYP